MGTTDIDELFSTLQGVKLITTSFCPIINDEFGNSHRTHLTLLLVSIKLMRDHIITTDHNCTIVIVHVVPSIILMVHT